MSKLSPVKTTAVFVLAGLAGGMGCSHDDATSTAADSPATNVQFALSASSLPACNRATDGEIWYVWSASQFYVCKGSTSTWTTTNINGLNAAVRVTPVAAGATCTAGGMTVQFGLDANRNGKLDDAEVASTTSICNGTAGTPGSPGPQGTTGAPGEAGLNSLVLMTDEPPGAHCVSGGVKLETGLDQDRNNQLDAAEVTDTRYVCNGTVASSSTVSGICIVADASTSLPNFNDPDVGLGYVKQTVPGVNDLAGLIAACTPSLFENLRAQHCAESTTDVQAEVVTYNADGTPNSLTCGSVGCDSLSCSVSGICIVREPGTNLPNFGAPDFGPGYAKQTVTGVNDLAGLVAACSDSIYLHLRAQHCMVSSTEVRTEVATYNADNTPNASSCGSAGCDLMACPPLSGACMVRDAYTDLPSFNDPDVGTGYAKQAVTGFNDFAGLLAACTPSIFENLRAQHCAVSSTDVQAEVVTYNADGTFNTTGCGSGGCEFMVCPQP